MRTMPMQILMSVMVALTIVMSLPSARTQLAASLAHVTKASSEMASAVIVSTCRYEYGGV